MLLALVAAWIVAILARLVDLQIVRQEEFAQRAKKQHERTVELPSRRGAITDASGRPLAVSVQMDSVFAIPSDIEDADGTADALARVLPMSRAEIAKKIGNSERDFVWLSRRVSETTAGRVRALRLAGIRLYKESTRRYPQGELAAQLIGYVGAENTGLAGLEHRFDDEVKGRPAYVTFMRDAAQRSYAATPRSRRPFGRVDEGVEGASLTLTLDASIQHAAERELAEACEASHARGGSVVVMEPKTGAILALASWPTFDPNRYGEADADAWRCRPVAEAYEPGSTFKVVTAAAALDHRTIGPDDVIDCGNGTLTIQRTTIHEHGRKSYGVLPLADVLAHSSNIGAARVGLGLGKTPFYATVRAFGFGQKTGIELDGETAGLLRDPGSWSALSLPIISFGQEIGVTVLQMTRAFCAVANGGVLPYPHVVAEIRRPHGAPARWSPPSPPQPVISEETSRALRRLLVKVVDDGTGKLAAVPGYTVAGKTGTAQKSIGGHYSTDRHVASFIGFAPADEPRVVVAAVVDEPKGKYYGGDVAAPVFAAVTEEALRVLMVAPRRKPDTLRPTILTADLASGAAAATSRVLSADVVPASRRSAPRASEEPELGVVPDVSGLAASEAVKAISRQGYAVVLKGTGFVVAQDPPAGSRQDAGGRVVLSLALAPPAPAEGEKETVFR